MKIIMIRKEINLDEEKKKDFLFTIGDWNANGKPLFITMLK